MGSMPDVIADLTLVGAQSIAERVSMSAAIAELQRVLRMGFDPEGDLPRGILDVPNGGTVAQLPEDTVLEVACRVDADGAHPLPLASPTLHQLGLVATVRAAERAVAEAALSRSEHALLRAFVTHPLVGSLDAARALAQSVDLPR